MARSLTVDHREEIGTSSLLNAFLFLCFGWLLLGMLVSGAQAEIATPAADIQDIYAQ